MKTVGCYPPISRLIISSVLLVLAVSLLDSPLRGQTFTVLHTFDQATGDGAIPIARMIRSAGNFYGTTASGGAYGCGTVFKFSPTTGQVTLLYSFTGGADGSFPRGSLIEDAKHVIYGTTEVGGSSNAGTIFKLDAKGRETVLYSFTGGADGAYPYAGLVSDEAGNLYGTTGQGGNTGVGVVFKLAATGQFTVLHSFSIGDGAYPFPGPLVLDPKGNLYGTTAGFGGTVFKLDETGNEVLLYVFSQADGYNPQAGLIRDGKGNLYGTTSQGGGQDGFGTVFKLDPTGQQSVLHRFKGGPTDGKWPSANLLRDKNGHLFGTTNEGGTANWGVIFELDENGNETVLHNFKWAKGGRVPVAGLVAGKNGDLYGSTAEGGIKNQGILFKLKRKR